MAAKKRTTRAKAKKEAVETTAAAHEEVVEETKAETEAEAEEATKLAEEAAKVEKEAKEAEEAKKAAEEAAAAEAAKKAAEEEATSKELPSLALVRRDFVDPMFAKGFTVRTILKRMALKYFGTPDVDIPALYKEYGKDSGKLIKAVYRGEGVKKK